MRPAIRPSLTEVIIIIYIYQALINALSAHMIHINLNTILNILRQRKKGHGLLNVLNDLGAYCAHKGETSIGDSEL